MRALTIAALLLSTSAFAACPTLSGSYKICTSSEGTTTNDTVVTQTLKNSITTYSVTAPNQDGERDTDTYIADGKSRTTSSTDPDSGIKLTQTITASCINNALSVNMRISFPEGEFANITMLTTKTAQRMTSVTTGTLAGEPVNQTDICE